MNTNLERLYTESENDASSLANAVMKHPRIDNFQLKNCVIYQNNTVMIAIVPALNHMVRVNIEGTTLVRMVQS